MTEDTYQLRANERDVSYEGIALMKDYCEKHNQVWNGMTDQLLHEKYGAAVRHVSGYGWVLTEPVKVGE